MEIICENDNWGGDIEFRAVFIFGGKVITSVCLRAEPRATRPGVYVLGPYCMLERWGDFADLLVGRARYSCPAEEVDTFLKKWALAFV